MIHVVQANSVDHGFLQAISLIDRLGVDIGSRAGAVRRLPGTLITEYNDPLRCVLRNPARDANPMFHLCEALWMIAGREDVAFPAALVEQIRSYSDDGTVLRGAYGHRWRRHFRYGSQDQLEEIAHIIRSMPRSRRALLQIWDANIDLEAHWSKDLPCNVAAHFELAAEDPDRLDLTVFQRSGDVIWGVYGANAVHFPLLLDYMAASTGKRPGRLVQITSDAHYYAAERARLNERSGGVWPPPPGPGAAAGPLPPVVEYPRLIQGLAGADDDPLAVQRLIEQEALAFSATSAIDLGCDSYRFAVPFIQNVAVPLRNMALAWNAERAAGVPAWRRGALARAILDKSPWQSSAWIVAAREWVERRAGQAKDIIK